MEWLQSQSSAWFGPTWGPPVAVTAYSLIFIVAILVPLILSVAYLTLWERKFIGWIQIRIGPNRVGPWGLLQPFADVLKLLVKEIILPTNANQCFRSRRSSCFPTSTPGGCTTWRCPRWASTA